MDRPAAHKYRGSRAAGGIHGEVGDRDANQMNECEAEANRDGGEALQSTAVRRATKRQDSITSIANDDSMYGDGGDGWMAPGSGNNSHKRPASLKQSP